MKKIVLIYSALAVSFLSNSANALNEPSFDSTTNTLSTGQLYVDGVKGFDSVKIQFDFSTSTFQLVEAIPASHNIPIPANAGYFKLTTQFRENENECLEGNQFNGSVLNGAAFMDKCQDVSGQAWKVMPAENGYFKLTTQFRENENECLEGNQADGSVLSGVAFMDKCQDVDGQLWKATSADNGYVKLTTKFRENENECLEGNQIDGEVLSGAAFMDKCQDVSGQLWKFQIMDK